jgi:hypothetical protein
MRTGSEAYWLAARFRILFNISGNNSHLKIFQHLQSSVLETLSILTIGPSKKKIFIKFTSNGKILSAALKENSADFYKERSTVTSGISKLAQQVLGKRSLTLEQSLTTYMVIFR